LLALGRLDLLASRLWYHLLASGSKLQTKELRFGAA
jgi:hypothetical protein